MEHNQTWHIDQIWQSAAAQLRFSVDTGAEFRAHVANRLVDQFFDPY